MDSSSNGNTPNRFGRFVPLAAEELPQIDRPRASNRDLREAQKAAREAIAAGRVGPLEEDEKGPTSSGEETETADEGEDGIPPCPRSPSPVLEIVPLDPASAPIHPTVSQEEEEGFFPLLTEDYRDLLFPSGEKDTMIGLPQQEQEKEEFRLCASVPFVFR